MEEVQLFEQVMLALASKVPDLVVFLILVWQFNRTAKGMVHEFTKLVHEFTKYLQQKDGDLEDILKDNNEIIQENSRVLGIAVHTFERYVDGPPEA